MSLVSLLNRKDIPTDARKIIKQELNRYEQKIESEKIVLQEKNKLLVTILENTNVHMALLDPKFNFLTVNI